MLNSDATERTYVISTEPVGIQRYGSEASARKQVRCYLGGPCSQYIDDRHVHQLTMKEKNPCSPEWSNFQRAEAAAFITTAILTLLDYTLALSNSSLIPSQSIRFLGYLSDSGLSYWPLFSQRIRSLNLRH